MKYPAIVLVFCTTIGFGQTTFDQSEELFNRYLLTDSSKAKSQLEYQNKHIRSRKEKTRYIFNQAVYYNHNNQFNRVESWLLKAKNQMDHGDVELESEFVRIRALMYFKQNRFKESNALVTDFFEKHTNVPIEPRTRLQLLMSENDIALGNYSKAHKRVLIGYKIYRQKPALLPKKLKVNILTSLYNTSYYQAKYDSALYYLYQSEHFIEEGTIAKATFYDRLAIVYAVMKKHAKAIFYYKKSIALLEKSNAPILLAYAYYNLGESTKEIDPEKAISIYEKALSIGRNAKYDLIVGYTLEELGEIYLHKKNYQLAAKHNREALTIMQKSENPHGIVNVLLNMGRLEYETGNFDQALEYLNKALGMTEETNDLQSLEYCYEYLYKSYEHMGEYKMAHHFHKLYTLTQRKIVKAKVQENIEKLNLTYEMRLERATNKLLKEEVQLKNKKLNAETNVKWLLGILLLALLITGWFFRRILLQRAKLKDFELQHVHSELRGLEKEKELATEELNKFKDQLISKNNLIGELNKLLLENEQSLVSKEQFGDMMTNDTDWVEFLAKLQLVFPQFTENLKTKHPNLSNNEFRLAALVRLSLSDKEISQLLIIEPASVKKAKNRLKQKLGLDTNDKLSSYLGNL